MEIAYFIFAIYFLLFEPVLGYVFFKRFVKRVAADPGYKLRYYKNTILFSWLPAAIIAVIMLFGGVSASSLGIGWIRLNEDAFGKWVMIGILAVFGLVFLLYLYQIILAGTSEAFRNRLASVKVPDEVGIMLPRTREERKYWTLISTSAGVFEELVYRGFLLFLLGSLFSGLHIYLCILISSILFGLAHAYQGPVGVLKTGVVGLLFALVYVCTGSLLPGILLHFVMDFAAKNIGTGEKNVISPQHMI